jgi:hypothetical protein
MKYRMWQFMGFAALALMLSTTASVRAEPPLTSPPIPPDQVATGRSGLGGTGDFVGTIVELSCDRENPPGTNAECDRTGHYYALQTAGELALQPLLAGTRPIVDELRSGQWTGKQVRVTGVRYLSTGAILVSAIEPQSGPGNAGFGLLLDDGERSSTRR